MLKVLGAKKEMGASQRLVTRHSLRETRKRIRILLAEDNLINREVAVRMLTKRGHTVTIAENGKEAVKIFESQAFDMILMDVQMPEMDGFEATAVIRHKEKEKGTHIPIVAMTAHAMKGDRERCINAGMDEYISKPIAIDELIKVTEGLESVPRKGRSRQDMPDVFDRAAALKRVDNDEFLLLDLAKMFCAEIPKRLAAMSDSLKRNDAEGLRRGAHSMKGSVSTFAASRATEAAARLEDLARSQDLPGTISAYESLADQVDVLRKQLEDFMKEDKRIPESTGVQS